MAVDGADLGNTAVQHSGSLKHNTITFSYTAVKQRSNSTYLSYGAVYFLQSKHMTTYSELRATLTT